MDEVSTEPPAQGPYILVMERFSNIMLMILNISLSFSQKCSMIHMIIYFTCLVLFTLFKVNA